MSTSEDFLVSRYAKILKERIDDSVKRHPSETENLCHLAHGMTQLSIGFLRQHVGLSARFVKSVKKATESGQNMTRITNAIASADPVRLGLLFISKELENSLNELMCQTYSGAARALRSALESAMSIAEFCTDEGRPKAEDILAGVQSGLSEEALLVMSPEAALDERFRYQQKFGLFASFGKLVEHVSRAMNTARSIDERRKINALYRRLSQYAHFSRESMLSIVDPAGTERSESIFRQLYDDSLRVVDISFTLMIRSESHYLGVDPTALVADLGRWIPGGEIVAEIDIVREREFVNRGIMFFEHSMPLIEDLMQKMRPRRLKTN